MELKATAEYISQQLSIQAIQDQVGEDVFWIMAEEVTEPPFLLYNFEAGRPLTKDGTRREYSAELTIVGKSIDEAAEKASNIYTAIKDSKNGWIDNGYGKPAFLDETGTTALVKLNYQFKL